MFELKQTKAFSTWRIQLRDARAKARIAARLDRLAYGLFGDVKAIGEGVSEVRIDYGQGYRIYFKQHGDTIIILLCGGDKNTQKKDIAKAKQLASEWSEK